MPGLSYFSMCRLTFWRKWIVAVAVAFAYLPVCAMNYVLDLRVLRNFSAAFNSFGLCAVDRRSPITSGTNISPTTVMRYRVNTVVLRHLLSVLSLVSFSATDGLTSA